MADLKCKKPLTWDQFRVIMNKIDKEHKLTPTSRVGIYTNQGKCIRAVMPIIDMRFNTVFCLTIFSGHLDGGKIDFKDEVKKNDKYDNLFDEIMEWLETKEETEE